MSSTFTQVGAYYVHAGACRKLRKIVGWRLHRGGRLLGTLRYLHLLGLQQVIFYYVMHPVVYRKCNVRVDEMDCSQFSGTQIS